MNSLTDISLLHSFVTETQKMGAKSRRIYSFKKPISSWYSPQQLLSACPFKIRFQSLRSTLANFLIFRTSIVLLFRLPISPRASVSCFHILNVSYFHLHLKYSPSIPLGREREQFCILNLFAFFFPQALHSCLPPVSIFINQNDHTYIHDRTGQRGGGGVRVLIIFLDGI